MEAISHLDLKTTLDTADIPCVPDVLENKEKSGWVDGEWIGRTEDLLVITETYNHFGEFLSSLRDCNIKSLDDLMQWNKDHSVRPLFPLLLSDPLPLNCRLLATDSLAGQSYSSRTEQCPELLRHGIPHSTVDRRSLPRWPGQSAEPRLPSRDLSRR